MSYIALYREWRPTLFEDVVEQEHVVKTLRYSVSTGRVAHAYLFCGTRGTGKTTMAHILSRAVNCLHPNGGDPCNQCEICRDILAGSCVDVLEIDAASNNSVDNVRAIRDEVIYAPTKARYKVYIIDEVHMLSTGAFNALLKTLEEPPEHVIFILATTEPHKLPATILSRCQRFDFRRISQDSIVKQLNKIASAGGVALDPDAARLMARMSDGAMRDAISLLDQCISLGKGKIGYDDVLSVVGIVNDTFMTEFVENMLRKNIPAILENISRLIMDGRDMAHFVSDLVLYLRNLLICKATNGQCGGLIDVPTAILEDMKKQSGAITQDEIIRQVRELSALETGLKWAANPRVLLEVTLIKLCGSSSHADASIADRLTAIENRLQVGNLPQAGALPQTAGIIPTGGLLPAGDSSRAGDPSAAEPSSQLAAATAAGPTNNQDTSAGHIPGPAPSAASAKAEEFSQWPKVMDYLKSMGRMKVHSFLLNTKAVMLDENNVGLLFSTKENFTKTLVSKMEHIELIEEAILKVIGREMKVKCLDDESFDKVTAKTRRSEKDELIEKARSIADKAGLPLEILDE
ncbi:MAG: DNA polymerase III subunit gamma/tau [Clostridiaceae bacterium]